MGKGILFMSVSGDSLPVAYRIKREGTPVSVYLHNPKYHTCYDGMLDKVTLPQLRKSLKDFDLVFFDITRSNERYRSKPDREMASRDAQLLLQFGLKTTEKAVYGPVADVMRKDVRVIGVSRMAEEWEMDRMLGYEIAKDVGLKVPESHEFKTFQEGAEFLKQNTGDLWICKPQDNEGFTYLESWEGELATKMQGEWKEKCKKAWPFVLQKVLPKGSVEIDLEGWFDGREFQACSYTMEDKYWMTGDWSIQIGCQNTIVWVKQQDGILTDALSRMEPALQQSGHVGPVNITAMVSGKDHSVNWLEATPRPGYDALQTFLTLLETPITHFLYSGFRGVFKKGYAAGARITIPPFPSSNCDDLENKAKGVDILTSPNLPWFWAEDVKIGDRGWLECAGADGIIGVVTAAGKTVEEAAKSVYDNIKKLKIGSKLQLRTDLGKRAERHIPRLKEWGFTVG
jgi:hypothetical protein